MCVQSVYNAALILRQVSAVGHNWHNARLGKLPCLVVARRGAPDHRTHLADGS